MDRFSFCIQGKHSEAMEDCAQGMKFIASIISRYAKPVMAAPCGSKTPLVNLFTI